MSTIKKPSFQNLQTGKLTKRLDDLRTHIEGAKVGGKVDLEKLEQSVKGDSALEATVDVVLDSFQRVEEREVSSGCGGGTETRRFYTAAKELDGAETQTLMSAVLAAKTSVETVDQNKDGIIEQREADSSWSRLGRDLKDKLAEALVEDAVAPYEGQLKAWREALSKVAWQVDDRQDMDSSIGQNARWHCKSDLGAEAVTWAYRQMLVEGKTEPVWDLGEKLDAAERSLLSFIPFVGKGRGHLSDGEVKDFLGVDDLAAFVTQQKAKVDAAAGGDYEAKWLKGADLENADQLDDPDFRRVTSGC
jgi:hypothetical protein